MLKLTGKGVSTIHARNINFIDAAVLDVSSLAVPAGTYRIIDGSTIQGMNLRLADGTDQARWGIRFWGTSRLPGRVAETQTWYHELLVKHEAVIESWYPH